MLFVSPRTTKPARTKWFREWAKSTDMPYLPLLPSRARMSRRDFAVFDHLHETHNQVSRRSSPGSSLWHINRLETSIKTLYIARELGRKWRYSHHIRRPAPYYRAKHHRWYSFQEEAVSKRNLFIANGKAFFKCSKSLLREDAVSVQQESLYSAWISEYPSHLPVPVSGYDLYQCLSWLLRSLSVITSRKLTDSLDRLNAFQQCCVESALISEGHVTMDYLRPLWIGRFCTIHSTSITNIL
jgi:hypothetical protein